jgi:hypothetical protein
MIVWNPEGADETVWERLRAHFTPDEIAELGYFISFISVQQRWIKTLAIGHGEVLNASGSGLSPAVAQQIQQHGSDT